MLEMKVAVRGLATHPYEFQAAGSPLSFLFVIRSGLTWSAGRVLLGQIAKLDHVATQPSGAGKVVQGNVGFSEILRSLEQ